MREIIDKLRDVVIQIATPYGSGTGFYLADYDLIVTNHHVVSGANKVIVTGRKFKKTLSPVVYNDPLYDLAFIKLNEPHEFPAASLGETSALREGDEVITIGHPFGLKYTSTQGIISKMRSPLNGLDYLQIDAPINPGNSGGPLIDNQGNIIGVNTFIIREGNSLGFALPVSYLQNTLNEFRDKDYAPSVRCSSCLNVVPIHTLQNDYCAECGNKLDKEIYQGKEYLPSKTGVLIEDMLEILDYNKLLARTGSDVWEIEHGSAKIKISYVPATKFVVADAVVAHLPKSGLGPLYEFLLRKNYDLDGMVYSIDKRDIFLSLLIYEDDMLIETATKHFKTLFKMADEVDDILISTYGCIPVNSEEES